MPGVSRRIVLTAGAAMAALAASDVPREATPQPGHAPAAAPHPVEAAARPQTGTSMGAIGPEAAPTRHGSVKDVKHVVILMQENRSFDHYFGTLGGVRGFGDRQVVRHPHGGTTFDQPDPSRPDGVLRPFRMTTSKYDAQQAADLDHSWVGTHQAANEGAWDAWVAAKGPETMGYFTRADIPWQYALADAFTVCDAYHCSVQGPTIPNRLHMWTGTNDPHGRAGGPVTVNPVDFYAPQYSWKTYPERLHEAGVSWQVYANNEVGYGDWLGDFGDNPLWLFHAFHNARTSKDPKVRELATRSAVEPWKPDQGKGHSVDHVLSRFIADCHAGKLPTVSWIVAPRLYSEHPKARPVDGAAYIDRVLRAVWANKKLWESTVVLLNYDENDGFFDHVIPPMPAKGTPDEFIKGEPMGLGPRLPLTVVSPWSRGGWVNSQVCDHTSIIRFLELVTGVHEPHITAWRRAVCGDLTSCFDFASFDPSVPRLPDVAKLVHAANAEMRLPKVKAPAHGKQSLPAQEKTARKHRPLPYGPAAVLSAGAGRKVTVTLTNTGTAAISYAVFATGAGPFRPTPVLVGPGEQRHYTCDTKATSGRYDLAVHGPNGFMHRFQGTAGAPSRDLRVAADRVAGGAVALTLSNHGRQAATFTLSGYDGTRVAHHDVPAGERTTVTWPAEDGEYDVTVTAGDLAHRYAGRVDS